MNILEKIMAVKQQEVAERKAITPIERLKRSIYYNTTPVSLKKYILRPDRSGIIAEIKRQSPSRGVINAFIDVKELSIGYMQAGASALSILTDKEFFGGSLQDLETARGYNYCPILRKDFILDPYQIHEAKSHGADAILLIARALTVQQTHELASCAHDVGLEVLLELHEEKELDHISDHVDLVGVNSRSLADFSTHLDRAMRMLDKLPKDIPSIAESGIHTVEDYIQLKTAGFHGFLIGTQFMEQTDPALACASFIESIHTTLDV